MPTVHPTAIVAPAARLADDVTVGAYCVVESDVEIGAGTELRPHAVVRSHVTLGQGNFVDSFVVIGGDPQDLKFDRAQRTCVQIGDRNVFREGVTISRATREDRPTVVGNDTYWMTNAHIGHDATVEDDAILTNNSGLGGHATLGARAILSGGALVHQFTWVGELAIIQGNGGVSAHVPPYTLMARINYLVGLNTIGLRRTPDITEEDRRQIKEAFRLTYQAHLTPAQALEKMDEWSDMTPAAAKFREFIRKVLVAERPFRRVLCPYRRERRRG